MIITGICWSSFLQEKGTLVRSPVDRSTTYRQTITHTHMGNLESLICLKNAYFWNVRRSWTIWRTAMQTCQHHAEMTLPEFELGPFLQATMLPHFYSYVVVTVTIETSLKSYCRWLLLFQKWAPVGVCVAADLKKLLTKNVLMLNHYDIFVFFVFF